MKLLDQLYQQDYHSCVMTSFGIDFSAFENVLLTRLRAAGCNNNLVIADAGMLAYAMGSASELPVHAGRRYTVTGANAAGVFHPKVILQLGGKSGRLFVSSANLTAPGLGGNKEVIGQVVASPGLVGESQLLASAWRYVRSFLDLEQEAVANQVARMRKHTAWLMDVPPADGLVSLSNGDTAAFLDSSSKQTIASRFGNYISGDVVKRLIVVSPYWDEDLRALRTLQKAIGATEICVLVGGPKPSFPIQALKDSDSIRFYPLADTESRFVHGKVYIAETKHADHVLYGSANCTMPGMGGARLSPGRNEEACLYRRMKQGAALVELRLVASLAKGRALKGEELPKWHLPPDVPRDAAAARHPGRFEIKGSYLLWWPSGPYAHARAHVELLDQDGIQMSVALNAPTTTADEARRYILPALNQMPFFARARAGDNTSVASIIVLPEVLRQETREPRSRRFEEESSRLKSNERIGPWILDFIDLIAKAEAVDDDHDPDQINTGTSRSAVRSRATSPASRTLSYEEFTAGRKVRQDRKVGFHQAFAGSDFDLVRSYLNRLIGLNSRQDGYGLIEDESGVRDALALEDELQQDWNAAKDKAPVPSANPELSEARRKQLEAKELLAANAARLAARFDIGDFSVDFSNQMRKRAKATPLLPQDMFRLRAVLLMMLGASYPIGWDRLRMQGTEWQVLPADGELPWARLIGRVLSAFFGEHSDLIGELRVGLGPEGPAVELVEGFATCFWAIQACLIAAEAKNGMYGLDRLLSDLSVRIYKRSGLSQVELQDETVLAVLEKMTSAFPLGISQDEMLSLHHASVAKVPLPQQLEPIAT